MPAPGTGSASVRRLAADGGVSHTMPGRGGGLEEAGGRAHARTWAACEVQRTA